MSSGFALRNETPLVETGYPLTSEFYPYYKPTTMTTGVTGVTVPFGCGVGCTGVNSQFGGVVPSMVESGLYNTYKYVVDVLNTTEDSYLTGHQIDGRVLYPTTGYLYLVWKSLAKMNGYSTVEQMPIQFENVEIHRATILALKQQMPTKQIEFLVRIVPKTGVFELVEGENVIVTGRVCVHESITKLEQLKMLVHQHLTHLNERKRVVDLLEQEEIYRELKMRGYEYNGEFQPILRADLEGTCGELLWTGKWIPFLDAMLQMNTLASQKRGVLLPTRIRSIKIDPFAHYHTQKLVTKMIKSLSVPSFGGIRGSSGFSGLVEKPYVLPVIYDPLTSRTVCGGVEIVGLHSTCTGFQSTVMPTINTTIVPTTNVTGTSTIVYPTTTGNVNFVPYVEKHLDDEYVIVDKCISESTFGEPTFRQNREFLEFYLNECKRYVAHVLRKIEQPTVVIPTIMPTVIPKTLEQQLEGLKIAVGQTTPSMPFISSEWMGTPYGKLLEGGRLLQLLVQVANIESQDGQYLYKVQKIFNEKFAYLRALEEDCVLNLVNNRSYYLKNIMDTVLENTHHICFNQQVPVLPRTLVEQPRLRVLEISPSVGQFFGAKVNNLMKMYPNRIGQIDYHYVPTLVGGQQTTVVPEEYIMELNKQLPYEIKKVEWNFGLKNGQLITEVPSHLREYDLVILNGGLSSLLPYVESEYELKKWLQTVVMDKVLKPQGFLFVHEFTNSFDLLSQLNRLEHSVVLSPLSNSMSTMPFKYTTGRFPYQKYQTEMQWRQLIEECGFYPVAMKSDVELSSMFLYRRPLSYTVGGNGVVVCGEEKVLIDEFEPMQWIKKVKVIVADKQVERVWIVSEKQPTVEIVSMITGLRREIGGEKIRCLFVADKQPVAIYGQRFMIPSVQELITVPTSTVVPTQWTELFGLIRKADLVMNVFRTGQWGSFRPISTYAQNYSTYPVGYPTTVRYPVGFQTGYPVTGYPTTGYPVEYPVSPVYETPVVGYEAQSVLESEYPTRQPLTNIIYRRQMQQQQQFHLQQQLITMGLPTTSTIVPTVPLATRVVLNPLQTYIITCGLGSFGLELVEWMVEHGARRVILTSKYGVRTGYQARKLRILRDEFNAQIQVLQVDVREEVECLTLIKEAVQMSVENKIGGIFHLASCIEDCLFEQQYPSTQIHEVLRKITEFRCQGAYNLDKLTRSEGLMDDLAYFVVFSSVFNQTTTVMEKICESRRRNGRHALAVHWGVTVDTGLMVESMFSCDKIVEPIQQTVLSNRIWSCLRIMENLLIKSVEPTMWSHFVPVEKYWTPEVYNTTTYTTGIQQPFVQYKTLVELLLSVLGVKDITRIAGCEQLVTLGELGLDSVLALELKQLFEQTYNFPLTIRDIHQLTIEKLRLIESRYPQGIVELFQQRPSTYFPRLRSVIRKNYF